MKEIKFRIYSELFLGFSIFVGRIIRWYVIKYTLDNKKHILLIRSISEFVIHPLRKFANFIHGRVKANASDEFWKQLDEFDKKYF